VDAANVGAWVDGLIVIVGVNEVGLSVGAIVEEDAMVADSSLSNTADGREVAGSSVDGSKEAMAGALPVGIVESSTVGPKVVLSDGKGAGG
jgi:hypothetical protein